MKAEGRWWQRTEMVGDVPKESLCSQVGGIFATELSWGQVYEKEMEGYRIGRTV